MQSFFDVWKLLCSGFILTLVIVQQEKLQGKIIQRPEFIQGLNILICAHSIFDFNWIRTIQTTL